MTAKKETTKKKTASKAGNKKPAEEKEEIKQADIELTQELIRYDYDDGELLTLADDLVELVNRAGRLKEEKKSAATAFESDIKKVDLTQREIIDKLHNKFEMRTMHCYCIRDYDTRTAYFFRADEIELDYLKSIDAPHLFELIRAGEMGAEIVKMRDVKRWELQRQFEFEHKGEVDEAAAEKETEKTAAELVDEETMIESGEADRGEPDGKETVIAD